MIVIQMSLEMVQKNELHSFLSGDLRLIIVDSAALDVFLNIQ